MLQILLTIALQMHIHYSKLWANSANYIVRHPDSEYFQNFIMKRFLSERVHLGDQGLEGRIFRKWNVGLWTESRWLSIGTGGVHLWMR